MKETKKSETNNYLILFMACGFFFIIWIFLFIFFVVFGLLLKS